MENEEKGRMLPAKRFHILLISADAELETRLTAWLSAQEEFVLVGCCKTLHESTETRPGCDPNILAIDLDSPDTFNREFWSVLKFKYPSAQITTFLTLPGRAQTLQLAVAAGTRAFLPKDAEDELFFGALSQALTGTSIIPDEHFFEHIWPNQNYTRPQDDNQNNAAEGPEPLTRRQREVLQLIAEGLCNKEIAERLCLSEQTVKNYVREILSKLGVHTRTQAVRWLLQGGSKHDDGTSSENQEEK